MKITRRGKRQMINNKITKDCIINAALTTDKYKRKQYLVQSGYSKSRFYEMIKKYLTHGENVFIHGNKLNINASKNRREIDIEILRLFNDEYFDCNFNDFVRYLKYEEGFKWIYYSYVYNLLKKNNKMSPDARKQTKKDNKKKTKNEAKNEVLLVPSTQKERSKKNIHIARNRTNRKGHIVEADACFGNFVNIDNEEWALHGYIDQATGKILSLYFDKEETTEGYFN